MKLLSDYTGCSCEKERRPEADEISDEIVAALKDILNALQKAEQAIELECNWELEVIESGLKETERDSCPWRQFVDYADESFRHAKQIRSRLIA